MTLSRPARAALVLLVLCAWLLLGAAPATAGVQRFAVLAGNNEGAPGMHLLYFAEDDAIKMQRVLTSVGGYQEDDVRVVLGGRRNDLLEAMTDVRRDIEAAKQRGDETLFLFYYSGHADENRLQLAHTWLGYEMLDELIERTGADVRLAFLDACQSGVMTGTKGGVKAPSFVFDISERLGASGQVVITSSSGDEASQESDEIGGSYFTHFLTSALMGAADEDADQRVTLAESYQYVYHETVYRTSGTRTGTQHPTFEWDLAGKGDVVLTDLAAARSTLRFPPEMHGIYAIFDRSRRMFVAEVDLKGRERKISLHPGGYLVQMRYPTHLEVARVNLQEGQIFDMSQARFEAVEYEEDVARGSIEQRIRKANLPRLALRIMAGVWRPTEAQVESEYLPAIPTGGAGLRFADRKGRWVAADVFSGGKSATLVFEEADFEVPVTVSSTVFGVWGGFATKPRRFQFGGGLGLSGAHIRRSFPETSVATQDLFTVAPGAAAWFGWHPRRFEIEIELRLYSLPYQIDSFDKVLGYSEGLLSFGYRF